MVTATLAILAGGEGRRMGTPKGELRVSGTPILSYLLDRFRWSGPTLLVTAPGRERPPGAERFTREVTDPTRGGGPLRGVLTALEASHTDALIVTPCDMPRVEARQLLWLVDALLHRPAASIVMLSRAGGRVEPFPLALRGETLHSLTSHFASGQRAMHSLMNVEGAVQVSAPLEWSPDLWTNLNAPDDLAAFDKSERRQ